MLLVVLAGALSAVVVLLNRGILRSLGGEPIQHDMDFTYDVEERLNSPGYGTGEAA
ncbi:hypothetical protein [Burkholderia sp. L27(2015)]|uniref:hypothetical protein n=1 Tax=Burkholderia sp. L27(2015) TaxID=1641858 RepID=UPI00131D171D|nr:hypothetical protein [Burkholderia sp. L27(2015)]